jgi:hypothetical protein
MSDSWLQFKTNTDATIARSWRQSDIKMSQLKKMGAVLAASVISADHLVPGSSVTARASYPQFAPLFSAFPPHQINR